MRTEKRKYQMVIFIRLYTGKREKFNNRSAISLLRILNARIILENMQRSNTMT